MILYIIQAHRDAEQIVTLARQISDGRNFCVINLDPRLLPEKADIERQLALHRCDRAVVRIGFPINWGGISQVHALLETMAFSLSLPVRWEFLINLSGDSVALAPQAEIREFYSACRRKGQRIHLAYFGKSAVVTDFLMHTWGVGNFDLSTNPIELYRRIPATVTPQIEALLQSRSSSPLFRWKLRGSIHVSDLFAERKLNIRALFPIEAESRKAGFRDRFLYGGRAWFTLERGAVERMTSDPILAEVNQLLEHFFCPDELFLHTYLGCTGQFKAEEINRRNQRYRNGDSGKIHDGMIDDLFGSGAFFARKISLRNCPLISARLASMAGESAP